MEILYEFLYTGTDSLADLLRLTRTDNKTINNIKNLERILLDIA